MNKEQLEILMKRWFDLADEDNISIQDMFVRVQGYEKWKVEMFYAHFAPLMAQIIDKG
jgi:hypothetical protein